MVHLSKSSLEPIMATRKTQATRTKTAVTIEPTVRHLWLASLGVLVATRRETNVVVQRVVAKADHAKVDVRKAATRFQSDLRGNIAGMLRQVQPTMVKFSSDIEARLAPVFDKLGLKPAAKRAPRKARKPMAKQQSVRRSASKAVKRAAKHAAR
jgi:hypothetical protein